MRIDNTKNKIVSVAHKLFTRFGFHKTSMDEIAKIANQLNHHPELVFKHNALIIRIHTHSASGITDKDFELAEKIDQLLLA